MLIIEVALGVALGVLILAFWREIITLGVGITALALFLIVGSVAIFFGYDALRIAAAKSLFIQNLWDELKLVLPLALPIVFFLLTAHTFGKIYQNRNNLKHREAYIFGVAFSIVLWSTLIGFPYAILNWANGGNSYIFIVGVTWLALRFWYGLRIRSNRRQVSSTSDSK